MQRPPEAAATSAVQQPRIAICDDWEQCALFSADWTDLQQLAELQFFTAPFGSTEEVARALADFDAVCLMRERTPFPRELIDQLPRLKRLLFYWRAKCSGRYRPCKKPRHRSLRYLKRAQ